MSIGSVHGIYCLSGGSGFQRLFFVGVVCACVNFSGAFMTSLHEIVVSQMKAYVDTSVGRCTYVSLRQLRRFYKYVMERPASKNESVLYDVAVRNVERWQNDISGPERCKHRHITATAIMESDVCRGPVVPGTSYKCQAQVALLILPEAMHLTSRGVVVNAIHWQRQPYEVLLTLYLN